MPLASKLKNYFNSKTRSRGDEYFRDRLAEIEASSDKSVCVLVAGTYQYRVILALDGDILSVSCACPYFAEHNLCKHIWATVLEIDKQRLLGAVAGRSEIDLVGDPYLALPGKIGPDEPASAPVPAWKKRVTILESALKTDVADPG